MNTHEELEVICNRLADGIATEADERRLGELLRSGSDARRIYRYFMSLHAALHWDYVAVAASSPMDETGSAPGAGRRPFLRWFATFAGGAVAAGLLMVALLLLRGVDNTGKPGGATKTAADDLPADKAAIAALLVDEVGAEFLPGQSPDGVRLGPGQYELVKGIVHLRFAQGADMVLVGPTRLQVTDAQHIRLDHGKVRVTAPPTAHGFTIATRAADYVDLGTEFGLRVEPGGGASDLYVFDGQVNVADPASGKVLSEVTQGESSRAVDGVLGAAPQLKESDFPTPGAIGFRRWEKIEQKLRQDPGLLAYFPFRKARDESVLVNSHDDTAGQSISAGRISGARWVTGRWPGKDALLFDRAGDFVQIEIPGEYEELSIAAWLHVDRLDSVYSAILNSDGYHLGGTHLQLTRQGFPRGGVIVEGSFVDEVLGHPLPLESWVHVASVISTKTRSQQIYINGIAVRHRSWQADQILRPGSCRLGNWLPAANDKFTNRALRGRIDELAIWNRALTKDEVKQLVDDGKPGLLWSKD